MKKREKEAKKRSMRLPMKILTQNPVSWEGEVEVFGLEIVNITLT